MNLRLPGLTALFLLAAALPPAHAAGNVTATLQPSGELLVFGDSEANSVVLSDKDGDSTWLVKGAGGTLVNGASSASIGPVTDALTVALGDGNDSIKILGGTVPTNLTVLAASGDNRVLIKGTQIGDYLAIYADSGIDRITLLDVAVQDPMNAFYSGSSGVCVGLPA